MIDGRLPDFLIVGAPRSGTTAMSDYLRAHPEVFVSEPKELEFFNSREPTPGALRWYSSHFDDAAPHQRTGEATPVYLWSTEAHGRMAATIPDARLIALLRNPVDRAYSHYWWRRTWGAEDRDFAEAVSDELDGAAPSGTEYLAYGRYEPQLRRLVEHFPRSSLLVLLFDDLLSDPRGSFLDVCRHIGVRPEVPDGVGRRINTTHRLRWPRLWRAMEPVRKRNGRRHSWVRFVDARNAIPFEPPAMDPTTRRLLTDHFSGPNRELESWLGRPIDWT